MSFSQLCRPKSRVISPERKQELATLLNNEGFQCGQGKTVNVPGVGINLTKRECYELAITMDPTLAEAYYNLGTILSAGEEATLGALTLSEAECFRRAASLDDSMAPAWFNLGVCMKGPFDQRRPPPHQQQSAHSSSSSPVKRSPHLLDDGNQQNEEDDEKKTFFYNRTDDFDENTLIPCAVVNEQDFSKKECYIRALEIDEKLPFAWFNLGVCTGSEDVALVGEESFSDMECFVSALNLDQSLAVAWAMSGRRLLNIESSDEVFQGKNVKLSSCCGDDTNNNSNDGNDSDDDDNQQQQEVQEGRIIKKKKPTIIVGGKTFNAQRCFIESLKLDGQNSSVWFLVGIATDDDEAIFDVSGKMYDKQSAFEKSLEIFQHRSVVWYELGSVLLRKQRRGEQKGSSSNTKKTVVEHTYVCGKKHTPLSCFNESLELDDYNARAWFNAGVLLNNEIPTINVHGKDCSERVCFERCLELDSSIGLAWFNLATTLKLEQKDTSNNNNNNPTTRNKIAAAVAPAAGNNNKDCTVAAATAKVGEEEFCQVACFVQSLTQNRKHRDSWFHLGRCLDTLTEENNNNQTSSSSMTASLPSFSSNTMMMKPVFSMSSNNNNTFAAADENDNNNEAESMTQRNRSSSFSSFVQMEDGESIDAKGCYEKCLELNAKDLSAWKRLARRMSLNDRAAAKIGKNLSSSNFSSKSSCSMSSAIDEADSIPPPPQPETANFNGSKVSTDDCMKMIVSLSSS